MIYKQLREEVLKGNKKLFDAGLVIFTWGNLSAIDRKEGVVAIKPSGVKYGDMKAEDIVIVDLNGKVVDGRKKPSVDLSTHLELYKEFKNVGSIVHTHSMYATAFAQSGREMECLGTTHADHFFGQIPITRHLTKKEMSDYEKNTGKVIIETFRKKKLNPDHLSACLVMGHGPFVWGKKIEEVLYNSEVLERIAQKNILTLQLNQNSSAIPEHIINKHFERKHGTKSYYGQK